MVAVHIKNDERKLNEAYVLNSFHKGNGTATSADRDAAAVIAARSKEAYSQLKKMEGKRHG